MSRLGSGLTRSGRLSEQTVRRSIAGEVPDSRDQVSTSKLTGPKCGPQCQPHRSVALEDRGPLLDRLQSHKCMWVSMIGPEYTKFVAMGSPIPGSKRN